MGLAALIAAAALAPGFHATVEPLSPQLRAQMTGVSWHSGCPVGLGELRLLTLTYHGFDGRDHTGRLVANRSAAAALFTEELAAALELIAGAPRIGRRRRHRGVPGMRRILLRATRYHLYYAPSDDGRRLFVLAVWSALRGKAPSVRPPS